MPCAIGIRPRRGLQLHVSLNAIEPPIWRGFLVEESITLGRLHEVLQIVMGWQDVHLHQFITGTCHEDRVFLAPPSDDGFGDEAFMARQRDETRVKARTLLRLVGFRDLRIRPQARSTPCTGGAGGTEQWLPCCSRAVAPARPEDVGGYGEILEAIGNPRHEDHAQMLAWGGDFDPERFNSRR